MKLIHVILLNYYLNVLFSFIYDIKSILIIAGICVTIYFVNKVFFPEDDDNKKKKKMIIKKMMVMIMIMIMMVMITDHQ